MRKYWKNDDDGVYELYLPPYSNNKSAVVFIEDVDKKRCYIYVSPMMDIEYDTITSNSVEEVQEELEYLAAEYIKNKIDEWETLLNCIEEE